MLPMASDQRKEWVAESRIAQETYAIVVQHPQYYDEFRGGLAFAAARVVGAGYFSAHGLDFTDVIFCFGRAGTKSQKARSPSAFHVYVPAASVVRFPRRIMRRVRHPRALANRGCRDFL